jgi:FMN phosphatase YigB (HAD superfamily)
VSPDPQTNNEGWGVLLDIGGTIWPDRWERSDEDERGTLRRLSALFPDLSPGECREVMRGLLDDLAVVATLQEQDTTGVIAGTLAAFRCACDPATALAVRRALVVPAAGRIALFPGAREFLLEIRALGLPCVVLSNASVRAAAEYERDFEALGIGGLISAVITSVDVGLRKPHPAMFEAALAAVGRPAAGCVMIGNSERHDIVPAVELGMRALRVAIEEPPPAASAAHAVVTSLAAATAVLRSWVPPAGV